MGLLTLDAGNYRVAIDYLDKRTLKATPGGPWTNGARYNLARAHEALGNIREAIRLYQNDDSPQSHGNKLRARWLEIASKNGEGQYASVGIRTGRSDESE